MVNVGTDTAVQQDNAIDPEEVRIKKASVTEAWFNSKLDAAIEANTTDGQEEVRLGS